MKTRKRQNVTGRFRLMIHEMRYADFKEPIDSINRAIQRNTTLSQRSAQFAYLPLEGWEGHLAELHGDAVETKMRRSEEVLGLNPESARFPLPFREYFL